MSVRGAAGYAVDTTWRTLLSDLGVSAADALRRAGLPEDLLERPSHRIATPDYHRLWRGIEAELGDPLIAIRVCEQVRSESFSPLLFAALCSPNLLVAARRVATYKALVAPLRLDVTEHPDRVVVEFTWTEEPAPPTSLAMMELLFGVRLARIGTREPFHPIEVTTTDLPDDVAPYEAFLGCPLRAGHKNRVVVATADAHRPFLTSNSALWETFEPTLQTRLAQLSELDGPATTEERVRAVLLEGIPSGVVSLDAVAARLATSTRTLQRQIEAERTTFQRILRETRESLARHYLERTSLPTTDISFLLGYDEPNSFARAFKTWTGLTPGAARTRRALPE